MSTVFAVNFNTPVVGFGIAVILSLVLLKLLFASEAPVYLKIPPEVELFVNPPAHPVVSLKKAISVLCSPLSISVQVVP